MSIQQPSSIHETGQNSRRYVRSGFHWDTAHAWLFDIDGTLLNSRDAVHYFAFHAALKTVWGVETRIDGVPIQGNTDPGILRAVLLREGVAEGRIERLMPDAVQCMCAEVERNQAQLQPEVCPSIAELLGRLHAREALLGVASGNLERIGWLKLEKAGLRELLAFGSFSFPRELRTHIFAHAVDEARRRLGKHASVQVVGDTPADIEAARSVGIPVVALATGTYGWEELSRCGPDACFTCAAEMLGA